MDIYYWLRMQSCLIAIQAAIWVEDITCGKMISFYRTGHAGPETAVFHKLVELPEPALIVEIGNKRVTVWWDEINPDDILRLRER